MHPKYRLPSIASLVAFESAARLLNFSEAAEELFTSQSAISRHISTLESRLNVSLFERKREGHRRIRLTRQGNDFYRLTRSGLENLQTAVNSASTSSEQNTFTLACTHEISHLFVMPRFEQFQLALGNDFSIKIITSEYETMDQSRDNRADMLFHYQNTENDPAFYSLMFNDAIRPVCSPAYYEKHKKALQNKVGKWSELTYLKMSKDNYGWVNWEDWFNRVGLTNFVPGFIHFDNYVYLLEAAISGRGLALGWKGLIEHYVDSGSLIALTDEYEQYESGLYASLTDKGKTHPAGSSAVEFFRHSSI